MLAISIAVVGLGTKNEWVRQMAHRRFRIMLVDDDPVDAKSLITTFAKLGEWVEVEHISDGNQAFERIQSFATVNSSKKPHLVVLDVQLPGCDGSKLYAKSAFSSGSRDIPIVMFSGTGHAGLEVCAKSDPRMICLQKPDSVNGYKNACLAMLQHAASCMDRSGPQQMAA